MDAGQASALAAMFAVCCHGYQGMAEREEVSIRRGGGLHWGVAALVLACSSTAPFGCGSSHDEPGEGEVGDGGRTASGTNADGPDTGGLVMACSTDQDCDDGIACTNDRCLGHVCRPSADHEKCPGGGCDLRTGCVAGSACATDDDCGDDDPCTVEERCDPSSRTCRVDVLDGDADGFVPGVCGGSDCDDDNPMTPAADDSHCDHEDNDCDGRVDEDVDVASDPYHCGACGQGCRSGLCEGGQCAACGDKGQPCCVIECYEVDITRECATGLCRAGTMLRCSEAPEPGCRAFNAMCIEGMCSACGSLDEPCCPDRLCHTGACTQGTCEDRTCGAPPELPDTPACSGDVAACFSRCGPRDGCATDCLAAATPACSSCLSAALERCEERYGCAAAHNRLRCCNADLCGSPSSDCDACNAERARLFNCELELYERCFPEVFSSGPCLP